MDREFRACLILNDPTPGRAPRPGRPPFGPSTAGGDA